MIILVSLILLVLLLPFIPIVLELGLAAIVLVAAGCAAAFWVYLLAVGGIVLWGLLV